MSRRYRGGFLNTALPVVTGQASTPGAWSLTDQMQYAASGVWPLSTAFGFVSGAEVSARVQTAIAADPAGNTYVAYRTNTTAANMDAVYLVKLDGNGDVVWQFRYSLSADTSSNTVLPTVLAIDFDSSGNLICGYIARYSSFASFGVLRITASDGSFISASRYRPSTASILENNLSLVRDNSGNIYVAFAVNVAGLGARAQICKIQLSDLAILWIQVVSSSTSTTAGNGDVTSSNSLAISPDSNTVYLTTRSFTSNLPRLVVFDSNGNRTAAYTLNGSSAALFVPQVAVDSAGDIYVSYRRTSNGFMSIAKYTSAFTASWRVETSLATSPINIYATGGNLTVGGNNFLARISFAGSVSAFVSAVVVNLSSSPNNFIFTSVQPNNIISALSMPGNGSGQGVYKTVPASLLNTSTSYIIYNRTESVNSLTTGLSAPTLDTYTPAVVSAPQTYVQTSFTSTLTVESNTYSKTTVRSDTASVLYQVPGTYSWIAPPGVTSVSVLAIGGGGGGGGGFAGGGGGGGGFSARNAITVVPGTSYSLRVASNGIGGSPSSGGTNGGSSGFGSPEVVTAGGGEGGYFGGAGGGAGGVASNGQFNFTGGNGGVGNSAGGGGGGAAGYSGNGGFGNSGSGATFPGNPGTSGTGGSGGGGAGGYLSSSPPCYFYYSGGAGGSVGPMGEGVSGAGGIQGQAGGVGSPFGNLAFAGGGAGGGYRVFCNGCPCQYTETYFAGASGQVGVVRIMWGNTTRAFPSTNAGVP